MFDDTFAGTIFFSSAEESERGTKMPKRIATSTTNPEENEAEAVPSAQAVSITYVEWTLRLPSNFQVDVRRNQNTVRLNAIGTSISDGPERVYLFQDILHFTGTTSTFLVIVIRTPTGVIRVVWHGSDIIIEFRYCLTPTGYIRWHTEAQFECLPNPTSIDCFGLGTNSLQLQHAWRNYVIRFCEGYPLVVIPMCEYLMLNLAFLREDPVLQRARERASTENEIHARSPITPSLSVSSDENATENEHNWNEWAEYDSTASEYERENTLSEHENDGSNASDSSTN